MHRAIAPGPPRYFPPCWLKLILFVSIPAIWRSALLCCVPRAVQNREGRYTAAALVPAAAGAGAHVHRRTILGQGFVVNAAHRTEAVLSRVPRRGQRVSDHQVRPSLQETIRARKKCSKTLCSWVDQNDNSVVDFQFPMENDRKQSKTIENDRKRSKRIANDRKWSKMIENYRKGPQATRREGCSRSFPGS